MIDRTYAIHCLRFRKLSKSPEKRKTAVVKPSTVKRLSHASNILPCSLYFLKRSFGIFEFSRVQRQQHDSVYLSYGKGEFVIRGPWISRKVDTMHKFIPHNINNNFFDCYVLGTTQFNYQFEM